MVHFIRITVAFFAFSASLSAESIDVIALEYPPFTTINTKSGGIAFELLRQRTESYNLDWKPLIVPPARAAQMLREGSWCASFYPASDKRNVTEISLSETVVKVGLIRKAGNSAFRWRNLSELKPGTVALLRTSDASPFAMQFYDAGLSVVFVDSITSAVQMVLKGRTTYALFDSVSAGNLERYAREQLQLSESALLETPITVVLNNACQLSGYFSLSQSFDK